MYYLGMVFYYQLLDLSAILYLNAILNLYSNDSSTDKTLRYLIQWWEWRYSINPLSLPPLGP